MASYLFPVACALSATPLYEAANKIGPSFSYTLNVAYRERFAAYELARRSQVPEHPFAPYINVVVRGVDVKEKQDPAWSLTNDHTGDVAVSEGF